MNSCVAHFGGLPLQLGSPTPPIIRGGTPWPAIWIADPPPACRPAMIKIGPLWFNSWTPYAFALSSTQQNVSYGFEWFLEAQKCCGFNRKSQVPESILFLKYHEFVIETSSFHNTVWFMRLGPSITPRRVSLQEILSRYNLRSDIAGFACLNSPERSHMYNWQ